MATSLDQRHLDATALARMLRETGEVYEAFAGNGKVKGSREQLLSIVPRPFDDELIGFRTNSIRGTGWRSHRLPSGPLHDAAEAMHAEVLTMMTLGQSQHGISLHKIEHTQEKHIELFARALDGLDEKPMKWILSRQ